MQLAESYLIVFNISKKRNVGNLIRTANAFGVTEVIVVGRRSYSEFGACGTSYETRKRHFYSLDEACQYVRDRGCAICGIEIGADAAPADSRPFRGSTAFMVGNEGTGLTPAQMAQCDHFVYVPQYGTGASVNVNVAAAIVLHHFARWAGFVENKREGRKFVQGAAELSAESPLLATQTASPAGQAGEGS